MGVPGRLLGWDQDHEAVRHFNLGAAYARGDSGLPQDERQAAHYYKLAADEGHAGAQFVLGLTYAKGSGVLPQDDREAVRLFKLAADQGNDWAQYSLGLFYAEGLGGLPQDEREAARLFKLASDQGLAQAKDHLSYIEVGLRQEEEEQAGQSNAPEGLILCDPE
jgi:TPR repeat protein